VTINITNTKKAFAQGILGW